MTDVIVCSCHRVSDRRIRREAVHGADTVEAVGRACGAGTDCGACQTEIETIICEVRSHQKRPAA